MGDEITLQRNLTKAFIDTMPRDLVLTPRTWEPTGLGGHTWVEGAPRPPQVMRLIEYNTTGGPSEPIETPDGQLRVANYELLAEWDAEIGLWDIFTFDNDRFEVIELYYNNEWSRRAKVARFTGSN